MIEQKGMLTLASDYGYNLGTVMMAIYRAQTTDDLYVKKKQLTIAKGALDRERFILAQTPSKTPSKTPTLDTYNDDGWRIAAEHWIECRNLQSTAVDTLAVNYVGDKPVITQSPRIVADLMHIVMFTETFSARKALTKLGNETGVLSKWQLIDVNYSSIRDALMKDMGKLTEANIHKPLTNTHKLWTELLDKNRL